jgi:hypothetical protein
VYTDIVLSQPKRNLCMTYSSNVPNLEDFLRIHLEFGSVFQKRRSVITSGATESVNPHTGELFYKKFRTFTKNEFRVLVDDMVLCYALCKIMYKADDEVVKRILNNLEIKSLKDDMYYGKTETLKSYDFLNDYTIKDMKIMNFTLNELKAFAFIKAYCTGDLTQLLEIINQEFVYTYQYCHVDYQFEDIVKEKVEFVYQNCSYKALLMNNPDNDIWLFSELPRKSTLTDAHLIARKLFNKIRLFELERMFGTLSLRGVQEVENSEKNEKWLLDHETDLKELLRSESTVKYCHTDEKGFNSFQPVDLDDDFKDWAITDSKIRIFVSTSFSTQITGPNEFVNRRLNINWEDATVHVGKRKLFSLPILGSQQSNHTAPIEDVKLNGIALSWWMKASRIEKLIKRDPVPVTKDDFEAFRGIEIIDNKTLFAIELNKTLASLDSLPSKVRKLMPEDIRSAIDDRLFHPDTHKIGKGDYTEVWTKTGSTVTTTDIVTEYDNQQEGNGGASSLQHVPSGMPDFMAEMMEELDNIDMSDIVISNPIEDEPQNIEDDYILQASHVTSNTSSTGSNTEQYLDFDEFQSFEAQNTLQDVVFLTGQTRTKSILDSIGNPSTYVVRKNYVDTTLLDNISTDEKLGLLYRLNEIIQCFIGITDMELLLAVTLSIELVRSLGMGEEWVVGKDYILEVDKSNMSIDIFLKYEGSLDDDTKTRLKKKGGKIKNQRVIELDSGTKIRRSVKSFMDVTQLEGEIEEYALIPLQGERLTKLLEDCVERFKIENFLNIAILKDCYYRLYNEPFVRTGFALQLLNELLMEL